MVTKVPAAQDINQFPTEYRTQKTRNPQTHSTLRPGSFDTYKNLETPKGISQYLPSLIVGSHALSRMMHDAILFYVDVDVSM